jgi:predicted Zn-dependent protease
MGCAQLSPRAPKEKDHAEVHAEQSAEMVATFETKRDQAQFEAARVRWREGDLPGCREQIDKLLARSPKHRGGRLMRAELRLYENKAEAALPDLEALAADSPKDAEVIHLYGLVLEALGRDAESLTQLQRATELAPHSEVYAASYQLAQEMSGDPTNRATVRPASHHDHTDEVIASD